MSDRTLYKRKKNRYWTQRKIFISHDPKSKIKKPNLGICIKYT